MSVGENIKRIRKEKGLTQKQLGELCGLADSAIRRYENGGANPKIETKKKIANALGVSVEEIDPDLENLSKDLARKEIRRQIKEINDSTELSADEKEQKITELQNIHFSIGKDLHQNEEKQLKELRNTFVSLNQNGKELMLNFGDMLYKDEKYRDEMVHPSKVNKDAPQE